MSADALMLLAYEDLPTPPFNWIKFAFLVIAIALAVCGSAALSMHHKPRRDLASIVVTLCAGSGILIGSFGITLMIYFWLYGSFDRQSMDILEQGLLLLAAAVLLDKIWAPPASSDTPPMSPPPTA